MPAIAIFARAPTPGRAKTRLIPLLGVRGAADFQAALISDTVRKVNALAHHAARYLFVAGRDIPMTPALSGFALVRQRGGDLGERLTHAFRHLLSRHRAVGVIGTDSAALSPPVLRQALRELCLCEAVLGPCPDGGFYLIGLRSLPPGLFHGVRWGSRFAFRDMLNNLLRSGLACSILEPIPDADRPADVRVLATQMAKRPALRQRSPALWDFLRVASRAKDERARDRTRK